MIPKTLRRYGVLDTIPDFQHGGSRSIPDVLIDLISILGLSVCALSVFCPVLSLAAARTPPADDRFREACPFVSVLYSVLFHSLCSPYRHLTIGIWVVCPGGVNLTLLGTASLKSQE